MKKKLKASTLVETIVALIVVLIVYGMVVNFFVNHAKRPPAKDILNIHFELKAFIIDDLKKKNYQDEIFQLENSIVEKHVIQYTGDENLLLLTYVLKDKDAKFLMKKEHVVIKE
jgi:hypothetical protein